MAVQGTRNPGQSFGPRPLRKQGQLVKLPAAHVLAAGDGEGADDTAGVKRAAQHGRACLAQRVADIRDLELVAKVRLVRAVLEERLLHVETRKWSRDLDAENVFPDPRPQPFDERENILFRA